MNILHNHHLSSDQTPQRQSYFPPSASSLNQSKFTQPTPASNTSSSKALLHVTTKSSPAIHRYRRSILPKAVVLIKDIFGIFQPVRALLDSCSEINLITQETVSRL